MNARRVEWWRPVAVATAARPVPAAGAAGSEAPFAALLLFTFVLLVSPQTFIPALAPLRIGLLTAAAALAACLLDRLASGRGLTAPGAETLLAGALVLWAVVTLPLSYWPGGSLDVLTDGYFKTLAIFWLLGNVVTTTERLRRITRGLALMALPLAAYAIHEYLAGRFMDEGPVKRILSYEAPLTQNPNDLALMLNLILPLTLALALAARRPATRLLFTGCALLDAVAIILTFSRAGFICLAVTASIYAFKLMRRPGRGRVLAAAAALLVAAPLLPHGYLERLGTITNIEADPTGSAQERWGDTLTAVSLVSKSPIVGAGLGMNLFAMNEARGPLWKKVHNVYLEYAVDLGLPGLALYLALFFACIRSTVIAMRRAAAAPPRPMLLHLAEGIQVSLAAFAVAALFHPVAYHFYFYYIAGLAVAARAASGPGTEAPA